MIDPREERLPKWAKAELARLRSRLATAQEEAEAARLATDPEQSSAVLDPLADIPIGLGHETVRFKLGGRDYIDIRVYKDPGGCSSVQLMGNDSLWVKPQVANVIYVGPSRG